MMLLIYIYVLCLLMTVQIYDTNVITKLYFYRSKISDNLKADITMSREGRLIIPVTHRYQL